MGVSECGVAVQRSVSRVSTTNLLLMIVITLLGILRMVSLEQILATSRSRGYITGKPIYPRTCQYR